MAAAADRELQAKASRAAQAARQAVAGAPARLVRMEHQPRAQVVLA